MVHRGISFKGDFFIARACARIKKALEWCRLFAVSLVVIATSHPLIFAGDPTPSTTDPKTVSAIRNLSSSALNLCLPAIESLGRTHNAAVVTPLAQALASDKRPLVRRYIVDALGMLRQTAAIPALKMALTDSDTQVRQSAVAALGLFNNAEAQDALADHAAQEQNPVVRRSLVHQMRFSNRPHARQALSTLSHDSDPDVQKMANDAVRQSTAEKK